MFTVVLTHGIVDASNNLLCTNTADLKNHLLTAFNHKRNHLQQDGKDQTFQYIHEIFNNIADETNGKVYNHRFEKIYGGKKVNPSHFKSY